MDHALKPSLSPRLALWLVFSLLLFIFHHCYSRYFPPFADQMGPDYSLFLPRLLESNYWYSVNGFAVQWFSPAFLAGQPAFADPQHVFFTLPQWLSIALDPATAVWLTLIISASMIYWGGVMLMSKILDASWPQAALVGGLLMFNAVLGTRLVVGHLNFHAWALLPWLAWLLMTPSQNKIKAATATAGCALIMAYFVFSGLVASYAVPLSLALLLLLLFGMLHGAMVKTTVLRLITATACALALSAAKLSAVFAFMHYQPRAQYTWVGASSFIDSLLIALGSLFFPSSWIWRSTYPSHYNGLKASEGSNAILVFSHEWGYGFSFAVAILAAILLYKAIFSRPLDARRSPQHVLLLVMFGLAMLAPVALATYGEHWYALLKKLPVVSSMSHTHRFTLAYVPVLAVMIGASLQLFFSPRTTRFLVAACLSATCLQVYWANNSKQIFDTQPSTYNPLPVKIADKLARQYDFIPSIKHIEQGVVDATFTMDDKEIILPLGGNDLLIGGFSGLDSNSPSFGYWLETFDRSNLHVGDPLEISGHGRLNLKNPACYVWPEENNCQPGDLFRADQIEEAKKFLSRRPWNFNISSTQKIANTVTLIAWSLFALAAGAWFFWLLWRNARGRRGV